MTQAMNATLDEALDIKIKAAQKVIIEAYERHGGNIFISWSGGKDSTILKHIALRLFLEIPVVFSNTTNELAEIMEYLKKSPDTIIVKPKMPFVEVVKKYGFPLVSKEVSQKVSELKHTNSKTTRLTRYQKDSKGNGGLAVKWHYLAEQQFDVTHKCCKILKKAPLEDWAKEHGRIPLVALMADESRLRQQLALFGKDNGKKIYPFLRTGWSDEDIWAYAKRYGIRFAECYYDRIENGVLIKARTQTGCEYCGFGITLEKEDRYIRSKVLAPKKFEAMMNLENNGVKFKEAIAVVKQEDKRPILGLYGVRLSKTSVIERHHWRVDETEATTKVKQCTHCGSKYVARDGFDAIQSFIDAPDEGTGNRRSVMTTAGGYVCKECHMPLTADLHMFERRYGVTQRLIAYICANLGKKTSKEVIEETGLSDEVLYDILTTCDEVKRAAGQ